MKISKEIHMRITSRSFPFLFLFFFPFPLPAEPLPSHCQKVVDYHIQVKLNTETHQMDGKMRLAWRNPSAEPVSDLYFHLYLNAFKNTRSTYFREKSTHNDPEEIAEGHWGWIDVISLRLSDGSDLASQILFEHPDDDNAEDQTVARVRLPQPVGPRQEIVLAIDFRVQLPEIIDRTGFERDYYMVAQWFPKLGVYEPAGLRGRKTAGWNCHQFHANSEFYADYGRYLVEITLPAQYRLGASGKRIGRQSNPDGTMTHIYEQDDIHDFAWTAYPDYVELRRTFSADKDISPSEYQAMADLLGRSMEEMKLSDVEIILLMQPSHLAQAERHFQAVLSGIKYFGLWYGRYPYPTITVVDPAFGAGSAGGMEYPTLITVGTSWLLNYPPFHKIRLPELTAIHEFGHQFWYALVGNNEFEEAWLDEGINSYSTGKIMDAVYGKDSALLEFLGFKLGEVEAIRMQNGPYTKYDVIRKPSWTYLSDYGFYSYTKPEIVLRTLENKILDERTMARILRTYAERFRFRHPASEDFYRIADEVSGQNLGWFFRNAIEGDAILDYAVSDLSAHRISKPAGVFDQDIGPTAGAPDPTQPTTTDGKKESDEILYENTFVIRRAGDFVLPVEIEYKREGHPPERLRWEGRDRWIRYRFRQDTPLQWVQIDPEHRNLLDINLLNNSRRRQEDARAAMKWSVHWLFWMQSAISCLGIGL